MIDGTPAFHPLLLAQSLGEGPEAPLIVTDLRDPSDLRELSRLVDAEDLPAGAVLVCDPGATHVESTAGGRTLVSRDLLWSLLDPLHAGRGAARPISDPLAAERRLREEGARFWRGLERWRELDEELRSACRRGLARHDSGPAILLDQIDMLVAGGAADPFRESAPMPASEPDGPRPTRPPDDPHDLADWFDDPAGMGALLAGDFQPRPQQGDMARDVCGALRTDDALLMEAGTGVGKTLAYLVPLLSRCTADGDRGVVSTHTLALQAQIVRHDLPRMRRLFPDLVFRRLMGRNNYLCRSRIEAFLSGTPGDLNAEITRAAFRIWLAVTREGRRDEVADHPFLKGHIRTLFDSLEPCSPSICYGRNECYVQTARRRAREADVVLVNHSLLMHDFAAQHALIGPYRRVIVDEAQRLPQVALDTFAVSCDRGRRTVIADMLSPKPGRRGQWRLLRALAAGLSPEDETCASALSALDSLGRRLSTALDSYSDWLRALETSLDLGAELPGRVRIHDSDEVFAPVGDRTADLLDACASVAETYAGLSAALDRVPDLSSGQEDNLATLGRACELLGALQRDVMFMVGPDDEDWVKWIQPGREGGLRSVGATRLESGDLLAGLWSDSELAPVLTSATLAVGEDFSLLQRELGVGKMGSRLITSSVDSPFDYSEQSLLLPLKRFPAPDNRDFLRAVTDLLERLARSVPRKTLALFTSYAALRSVDEGLRDRFAGGGGGPAELDFDGTGRDVAPPILLSQGSGPPPSELIARFRDERRAMLLGTNTFWEGIDFPGEDLEILVVVKLPFLVPADPWVEARCERMQRLGENPFTGFMLADAVLRLRQGVGRLIRSTADRGVAILLDSRLHAKPYGMTFLKAMPTPADYCADADEAVARTAAFFARGA